MTGTRPPSTGGHPGGPPLVVERAYRATAAELWSLWTTKAGFESWWGPEGFRSEVHELDARAGGLLRYDMIADTPAMIAVMQRMGQAASHPVRATFAEFKPNQRLVIRNMIDFLPGVAPYESTIVVEFLPAGELVRMVVTLARMHDDEMTARQLQGFASQLSKLDRRFTGPPR
jgi:uncharacterized protein YndB with AHSA1/START domain